MGHLGIQAYTEPYEAQVTVWYLSSKTLRLVDIHVYNDPMSKLITCLKAFIA